MISQKIRRSFISGFIASICFMKVSAVESFDPVFTATRINPETAVIQIKKKFQLKSERKDELVRAVATAEFLGTNLFDRFIQNGESPNVENDILEDKAKIMTATYKIKRESLPRTEIIQFTLDRKKSLTWQGDYAVKTLISSELTVTIDCSEDFVVILITLNEVSKHPGGLARVKLSNDDFYNRVTSQTSNAFNQMGDRFLKAIEKQINLTLNN